MAQYWPIPRRIMPPADACLSMTVPFDSDWIGMIKSQLWQLTRWYNYERNAERDGKFAADAFVPYYDSVRVFPFSCPDLAPLDHGWLEDGSYPISHTVSNAHFVITDKNKDGNVNNWSPYRPEVYVFPSYKVLDNYYLRAYCAVDQLQTANLGHGAATRDCRILFTNGVADSVGQAEYVDCFGNFHPGHVSGFVQTDDLRGIGAVRQMTVYANDPFVLVIVAMNPLICFPA